MTIMTPDPSDKINLQVLGKEMTVYYYVSYVLASKRSVCHYCKKPSDIKFILTDEVLIESEGVSISPDSRIFGETIRKLKHLVLHNRSACEECFEKKYFEDIYQKSLSS